MCLRVFVSQIEHVCVFCVREREPRFRNMSVCMRVCVCEREREKGRKWGRWRKRFVLRRF